MMRHRDDTNQLGFMPIDDGIGKAPQWKLAKIMMRWSSEGGYSDQQIQAITNVDFETCGLARAGFVQVPLSGIKKILARRRLEDDSQRFALALIIARTSARTRSTGIASVRPASRSAIRR